jgi:uncharacterized membrane protein YhiD involved in acid resistance
VGIEAGTALLISSVLAAGTAAASIDAQNQQIKAQDQANQRQADMTNAQLKADKEAQDRLAATESQRNISAATKDSQRRKEKPASTSSLLTNDAAGLASSLLI